MEQRAVIKYLVAEKWNDVKFLEEFVMCMKKHILDQNIYKSVKYRFATTSQNPKDIP